MSKRQRWTHSKSRERTAVTDLTAATPMAVTSKQETTSNSSSSTDSESDSVGRANSRARLLQQQVHASFPGTVVDSSLSSQSHRAQVPQVPLTTVCSPTEDAMEHSPTDSASSVCSDAIPAPPDPLVYVPQSVNLESSPQQEPEYVPLCQPQLLPVKLHQPRPCDPSTSVATGTLFPPGTLGDFDNATLSSGLFVHYNHVFSEPQDVFGTSKPVANASGNENTRLGVVVDQLAVMEWTLEQCKVDSALLTANTILVLSDTRPLSEIDHWKHTSRFILGRTRWLGPDRDQWHVLYVPSSMFHIHFVWTAVYVIQALAMIRPDADLVMWDHDAAPIALFENKHLVTLAQRTVLPYRNKLEHIGALLCTEPHSRANAGVVWFPRLINVPCFQDLLNKGAELRKQILESNTHNDIRSLALKTELHRQRRFWALCERKQDQPMTTCPDQTPPYPTWTDATTSDPEKVKDYLRRQTALDWNLETEFALLEYTPLHRSRAESRDDLIFAWAALGCVVHATCFPEASLTARRADTTNLGEAANRAPSLGGWAGPCFEQTCVQALYALQSSSANVVHLPGSKLFMEPYVPGDLSRWMPAPLIHAYGDGAKALIGSLDKLDTLYTLDEILTPRLVLQEGTPRLLLPMIFSPGGFCPQMGTAFHAVTIPEVSWAQAASASEEVWIDTERMSVCKRCYASLPLVQATWPPLSRFSPTSLQTLSLPPDGVRSDSLTVVCPGLHTTEKLPGTTPDVLLTNPSYQCTYGPTGLSEERWKNKQYQMPMYPSSTLHGLKLLLRQRTVMQAWKLITSAQITHRPLRPLPSFWHLPAESHMVGLCILLAQYSEKPMLAVKRLISQPFSPLFWAQAPTPVIVYGFSAGSQTGFLVYRMLLSKGRLLGLKFEKGALGSLAMHPIYFYDFDLHDDLPPLLSAKSYVVGTRANLPRPLLLHSESDNVSMWWPSSGMNGEEQGVRSFGYPLVIVRLPSHLAGLFGRSGHSYSHLLVPLLEQDRHGDLDAVGLFAIVDVSSPSEKLFCILLVVLCLFTPTAFAAFIATLAQHACPGVPHSSATSLSCVNPPVTAEPASHESAHSSATTLSCEPVSAFWQLLQTHATAADKNHAMMSPLESLHDNFVSIMSPLPAQLQRWILFFALPGAFLRHARQLFEKRRGFGSTSRSEVVSELQCLTKDIIATVDINAVIGTFSANMTLVFHPETDSLGWAVFRGTSADSDPTQHIPVFKSKGKGKGKDSKLDRSLRGFQSGDIVRFSLGIGPQESLTTICTALVVSKRLHETAEAEFKAGKAPFDRIGELELLVTIIPNGIEQVKQLQSALQFALLETGRQPAWQEQDTLDFQQLQPHLPSLFTYLQRSARVQISQIQKIQTNLLPAEWKELLHMPTSLFPLLSSNVLSSKQDDTDNSDSSTAAKIEGDATPSGLSLPTQTLKQPVAEKESPWPVEPRPSASVTPFWDLLHAAVTQAGLLKPTPGSICITTADVLEWYHDKQIAPPPTNLLQQVETFLYMTPNTEGQGRNLLQLPGALQHFWYVLAHVSPSFCFHFANAVLDKYEVVMGFLVHIGLHADAGRQAALIQGLVGAGKTFTAAMFCFLVTVFLGQKVMWVSHNNKPLEEAASCLHGWILSTQSVKVKEVLTAYFCRLLASDQTARFSTVDIPHQARRTKSSLDWKWCLTMLITTTAFAAACSLPNSKIKAFLINGTAYLIFDEAQQFGDATDAWLLSLASKIPLVIFLGDQAQPLGASNNIHMQKLLKAQLSYRPTLLRAGLVPRAPHDFLANLKLIDDSGMPQATTQTFRSLLNNILDGTKLAPASTIDEVLGYHQPGPLMLPVSARVPPCVYQIVVIASYAKQLLQIVTIEERRDSDRLPPDSVARELMTKETCTVQIGYPCYHKTLPPSVRGLYVATDVKAEPPPFAIKHPHECEKVDKFYASSMSVVSQFSCEPLRRPPNVVKHCLRYGIYVMPYANPSARSSARSQEPTHLQQHRQWLDEALDFVATCFTVQIFCSLQASHQDKFCLGFFCPWKCLNDEVHALYSVSIDDSAEPDMSLLDLLTTVLKKELVDITLDDIHYIVKEQCHLLGPYITAGTSISSASANVRHSIVVVPQHTSFTAESSQALVSISRAQGIQFLLAPPTCLRGYFRLAIPLAVKQTGLTQFPANPLDLHTRLRDARPTLLLPEEVQGCLGLDVKREFQLDSMPLGLILRMKWKDTTIQALLQLFVSPAYAHKDVPKWISLDNQFMWAWRQFEPFYAAGTSKFEGGFFLLQFSTALRTPVLTLYYCKNRMRQPLATISALNSVQGVILFDPPLVAGLDVALRQATPAELLYNADSCSRDSDISALSNKLPLNATLAEASYPLVDEVIEDNVDEFEVDVFDDADEEVDPFVFGFHYDNDDIPETMRVTLQPRVSLKPRKDLIVEDADKDKGQEQDNQELVEVIQTVLNTGTGDKIAIDVLRQVALCVTPTDWACIKIPTMRMFERFTNVLFVHGVLSNSTTEAVCALPTIAELEDAFFTFLASLLVQVASLLLDYPPLQAHPAVLDRFSSALFWKQQLTFASASRRVDCAPPRFQLLRLLGIRKGNWQGHRLGFTIPDGPLYKPFEAITMFLPVQLGLWITAALRDKLDSNQPLSGITAFPAVHATTYTETTNKPAGGRLLRANLEHVGIPFWPKGEAFPHNLHPAQLAYLNAYEQHRISHSKLPWPAIKAQVNISPISMNLPLSIYTVPPKRTDPGTSSAGAGAYCAKPELAGPTHMSDFLDVEVLNQKLAQTRQYHCLGQDLAEALQAQARTALLPVATSLQGTSQMEATTSRSVEHRQGGPPGLSQAHRTRSRSHRTSSSSSHVPAWGHGKGQFPGKKGQK